MDACCGSRRNGDAVAAPGEQPPIPDASPSVLFSPALKDPVNDWAERGLAIPHFAIRGELGEISRVLCSQSHRYVNDVWRVKLFYSWFNTYFAPFVHEHHEAEEKIYFPFLLSKPAVTLPPKITASHKDLLDALANIQGYEQKILDAAATNNQEETKARVMELCAIFNSFASSMLEHLAEEEEVVPPILHAHYTEEEEKVAVEQILKHMGMQGNARLLPLIAHHMERWAGVERTEAFLQKELPLPIRALYYNIWKGQFYKENRGMLNALMKDCPPQDPVCTIL